MYFIYLSIFQFGAYNHFSSVWAIISEPPNLNNENFDKKSLDKLNQFLGSNYKMQVNYGTTFVVFIHWTYRKDGINSRPSLKAALVIKPNFYLVNFEPKFSKV